MTPYYEDSHVTLWHANNLDVLPHLDTKAIDLLLTDPPYGVASDTDSKRFTKIGDKWDVEHTWPAVQGDDKPFDPTPWLGFKHVILWGWHHFAGRLPRGRCLVWDKRFPSGKAFLGSDGETAWMKNGNGLRIYAQTWIGVCRSRLHASETPVRILHPTQKPVALGRWCIQQARNVQTMLDPFAGSCSFAIAAKTLGIRCVAIEIDEAYCETAARRLERTSVEETQP